MTDRLVLITGGTGYVGSVLVPMVAKKYPVRVFCNQLFGNPIAETPNVEFIEGDIRDENTLAVAMRGVTDVIHLAGVVTDELVDMNPGLAREINVEAMNSLCQIAKTAGANRFIYASSSSIYGAQDEIADETMLPNPMTEYAKMKLAGETILNNYQSLDFTVCSVRCATCAGPAPRMRLDTIVNVFCKQAYFDHRINVHGGGQWRTNIHVEDAAAFYTRLLDADPELIQGEAFNVTAENHHAIEIARIVRYLAGEYGLPASISVDTSKQDPRNYRMTAKKAEQVLGWQPRHDMTCAINDNFRWFKAGGIEEPDSDLYYNNRRMKEFVKG